MSRAQARRVRWSAAAQRDLDDIVDFIASDSSLNADRVLDRLARQAAGLAQFAERGRRIPEFAHRPTRTGPPWRELLVRPWRMLYAIDGDLVLVLAVVDGRRDLHSWLSSRNARDLSRREA